MMKFLFVAFFFLFIKAAAGQNPVFTAHEIDSIVKRINATCVSGGITDYSFHKKGHRKKTVGGGADWYYTDSSGKKLLKVVQEISIGDETFNTYYFYNDSLIYLVTLNYTIIDAKLTTTDKKINWQGNYYFNNGVLLQKEDNMTVPFRPELHLRIAREYFGKEKIWRRFL